MDDLDKTIAPHREHANAGADDVTMPGKRDRKPDGCFADAVSEKIFEDKNKGMLA